MHRTVRPLLVLAALAFVLALSPAPAADAQGCSMCRTVGQGADDPQVKGMFKSLIFMVSMPVVLVLGVGGWMFYHIRRAEAGDVDFGDPIPARVIEFRRPQP